MSEFESANMTEAADQSETQSANMTETADPSEETVDEQEDTGTEETTVDEQDSKTNAAFAEQRREIERLQAELDRRDEEAEQAELDEEEEAELDEALDQIINYARAQGIEDDDLEDILDEFVEDYEQGREIERLQAELERVNSQLADLQLQQLASSDLAKVQNIDPSIKDLDDLGEEFFALRAQGIAPERAYFMLNAADERTKPRGGYAPGKVNKAKSERDYYTSEELDNLTDAEMDANWDKVVRSMNML